MSPPSPKRMKAKKKKGKTHRRILRKTLNPNGHYMRLCISVYYEAVWIPLKASSMFHIPPLFFPHAWTVTSYGFTVQETKITVHTLKNIKNGHTVLFTHLKIILLQYFQFSIFSFSNNKFNPNGLIWIISMCLVLT